MNYIHDEIESDEYRPYSETVEQKKNFKAMIGFVLIFSSALALSAIR
mgnify:CR=1 FL=1